ncbi:MAG: thrombospondin type 3 repeat-containing protein, partial [Polyangiaceae bacterium]|nr:thrombospondin type 3 repeat-containing protein [Polyangiaceae bacterium]
MDGTAVVASVGCAAGSEWERWGAPAPAERLGDRAEAVAGGQNAQGVEYPFVGQVLTADTIGGSTLSCSAVLVSPSWVLLARHCFNGDKNGSFCLDSAGGVPPIPRSSLNFCFHRTGLDCAVSGSGCEDMCFGHSPAAAGPLFTGAGRLDVCQLSDDPAQDLALVQLDARIPTSKVRPIDLALPGLGRSPCFNLVGDADDFEARLVGFGSNGLSANYRNFKSSTGWDRDNVSGGFAWYGNSWLIGVSTYEGLVPGDSGGALLVDTAGWSTLCGINSADGTGLETRYDWLGLPYEVPVRWSRTAAVDSDAAEQFLLSNHLVDAYQRPMGSCDKVGAAPFDDIDQDGDLVPDACDPCPTVPDAQYRASGVYAPQFGSGADVDADLDGVPDVCDNCPATPNPFSKVGGEWVQGDSDSDGVGDACDGCGDLADAVCCTTNADCNPRRPAGTLGCRPRPNLPPGHPCAGGSMCDASIDSDGDAIGDLCDNCPRSINVDQADREGDGIGDACDTCPTIRDSAPPSGPSGTLPCTPLSATNAATTAASDTSACAGPTGVAIASCIRLATGQGICTHSKDADQDGVGDVCDNCQAIPNTNQSNCNIDIEKANSVPFPYVGDACDREPCARVAVEPSELTSVTGDDNWAKLRLDPILLPANVPGAYPVSKFVKPRIDIGARACACRPAASPGAAAPPKATPALCKIECPPDASQFGSSLLWTRVDIVPSSELGDPPAGKNFPQSTFLADSIYPNRPVSPPGTPPPQGSSYVDWDTSRHPKSTVLGTASDFCAPGFGFNGVLWTSAQSVAGFGPSPTIAQLAHHYAGGILGTPPACSAPKIVTVAPCLMCGDQCTSCSMKEMGYLTMADMEEPGFDPSLYIWGLTRAQQFTTQIGDDVRL